MTREIFEMTLCHHCAPVLMGWKPSNLVSFSSRDALFLREALQEYSERLADEGLRMEVLCSCRKHEMVLVYRPGMLDSYLSRKEIKAVLRECGYPTEAPLSEQLGCLEKRFSCHEEFPHEIGLFLGYPLEDVRGFQLYKGKNCKLCGYWKVYGDVERAARLFRQFDEGRAFLKKKLQEGIGILQVLTDKQLFPIPEADCI